MHECPSCGQMCDCDGEDIHNDFASEDCVHPQMRECLDDEDPDDVKED